MNIQMLLVLIALALFSTMLLNTYNILLDQSALVYDNMLYLQGQKIADRYFQKLEAELLGTPPILNFTQIDSICSSFRDTLTVNNIIYNIQFHSAYCDISGNTSFPDPSYQRVDIRINCLSTSLDTLYIGTMSSPFSKVFFDRGY